MGRIELRIVHKNGDKKLNYYRVFSEEEVISIGSSSNAKIRIMDKNVDDIHASIEHRMGQWHIIDLASKNGTWIGKTQVNELPIENEIEVSLGGEKLHIIPKVVKAFDLYLKDKPINLEGQNIVENQQVVFLRESEIIRSDMLKVGQIINFKYASKDYDLKPAQSDKWVEDKIGVLTVRRRNVRTPFFVNPKPDKIIGYFPDIELLRSFGIGLGITVFFLFTLWLMPKLMPKDPNALEKNKYTQMIFDPEVIKKREQEAKKQEKKLTKKEEKKKEPVVQKEPEKKRPVAMPQTEQAKKVVTQLKSSGLSDKISKIASVSLATDSILESANQGVSKSRNRSFASKGVAVKGATLSKNAGAYNVTAVATNGVEGGTAAVGKLGGLSAGGVGGGSVVDAIEEETEISGGIDPAIIRDVVQKNMGRIRYCYERELAANPSLYGKIKLSWIITAGGAVTGQKVEQTTMKNSMVEGCMLRIVQRWTFPRPDGGGDVIVAFPFFFKANN